MAEGTKGTKPAPPPPHAHPHHHVHATPKAHPHGGNALAAVHAVHGSHHPATHGAHHGQGRAQPPHGHTHPTGVAKPAPDPATTRRAGLLETATGGTAVNEIGIVAWDREPALKLRSSPNNAVDDNILGTLPFNTRVQVMQSFASDWLLVATLDGKMGYCARPYVWYPPAHKMPEPNARLHKVEAGEPGYAINIARHYYGAVADKWGWDLRFYVNVLGAVNHLDVPDSVGGWKTVQFPAERYIWIPSVEFARTLHSVLSSGSISYSVADYLGVAGFIERVGQLLNDFKEAIRLSGEYLLDAIARHVEDSAVAVLKSLLWMAIGAVALLAITTAIGAAIGALFGGVGAAPGAAAGFEVGMALLEWIGLGFLIAWIAKAVAELGSAFGGFLADVWNARGNPEALDRAARSFAEAVGTLCGVLVEALAMWAMSVGIKAAIPKLKGTALGEKLSDSELGEWLSDRINNYKAGKSPLPGPKETFKRLRDRWRRGRGDDAPPPPVDAWEQLAQRHNLDPDVAGVLRDLGLDPNVVERLLDAGMDQYDIANLGLEYGADGVRAADRMVRDGTSPRAARYVIDTARDMGRAREIIELVNSGNLENLRGLREFLDDAAAELRNGQRGKYNQLMEAHDRAVRGNRVSIEGRRHVPGDSESGQADVVDYTQRQAIQMKTVTSESPTRAVEAVERNLQSAIDQLAGRTGERPPDGFQRIADIRIDQGSNPLRFASREQIAAALRGGIDRLDSLSPPGSNPGLIRITNAISTFIFTPAELR